MIKAQIQDSHGTDNSLKIDGEGAANVIVHPHPPRETLTAIPFRQYFRNESTSEDMTVDGGTLPIDCTINALQDRDLFIKTLSIQITGAGGTLNEFGNISALTNGVEFLWFTQKVGEYTIHEGMKTNWEMLRMCATEPFGGGGNAHKANNVAGGEEGFTPVFDASRIFGMPYGLKLTAGTNDKLIFRVRDNISSVASFNIIAYGLSI